MSPSQTPCAREGCERFVARHQRRNGAAHCSVMCTEIDAEFARLQKRSLINTPEGTAAWLALVDVGDHWAEYQRLRREVSRLHHAPAARADREALDAA